ncbi:MAG: hypothetical protein V1760_00865 [Candidatus Peregrinibacteria bacterium]
MDRQGYRPAGWPELLALGANHPELQRSFGIVGIGSVWHRRPTPDGIPITDGVPIIVGQKDKPRGLRILPYGITWDRDYRYAAVRK